MPHSTLHAEDIKAAAPSAQLMYADYQGLRGGEVDAVMQLLLKRQRRSRITMWVFVAYEVCWGVARLLLAQHFEREVAPFEILVGVSSILFGVAMMLSLRSVTRDLRALERLRAEHAAAEPEVAHAAS